MKKIILLLLLVFYFTQNNAQLSTYDWSSKIGTSSAPKKALIDNNGNIYVWVNAAPPITIGTTTYTNTTYDNYLIKYNSSGTIVWSKEIRIRMFNMCLTKDSSSVLICGFLQSNYTSYDLGNSISTGTAYYSAGIIYKVDGTTGNSLWVKDYDATLPVLSNAIRIDAIYETNKGIFCVQGLKIRRLNFDGTEIWSRTLIANGTSYSLNNSSYNSWADDDGNTFFMGSPSSSNTTIVTLNSVSYTTTANQFQTQFSLDSSGNTNWFYTNMNFYPKYGLEVTKDGYVVMAGDYVYYNGFGYSNHPFIPNYCNKNYNIFKGILKTAKAVWSSYSYVQTKAHLASDGCLYIINKKNSGSVDFMVGTTARNRVFTSSENNLYAIRINNIGTPDSIFLVANTTTTSPTVVNFFRNNNNKFVGLFVGGNGALTFNNGNANLNTTTTSVASIVQFTAPNLLPRHTTVWTGTTDGNWFTASNWSNGVPTDSSNVIFNAGAVTYPTTNNNYYNYSTNKWANCGFLQINTGVNILLGSGILVNGILQNNGTITYFYNISGGGGNYSMWSTNVSNGNIIGNGTIIINTVDGMYYNLYRTDKNKIKINLFNSTDKIYFSDCYTVNSFNIQKGNLDFSSTSTPYLYVDSLIEFTSPSRMLSGNITSRAMPNIPVIFPLGDATNLQPATVTIQNATQEHFLSASFSNTITGSAPNASTCIVNGQGIASTLNGGMWTITALTPLQSGAYYTANFKLKGSTNAIAASRYALLKRNNSSSNWEVAGTYQPAMDSASYAVSSATNITSFSDFAIGIANGVLPFQSIKLSVLKQNNIHQLSWNIIATDGDKIEIQKSNNGISFSTIHTQNFVARNFYADAISVGKNYYRLKVIDKAGNYSYSNIVMIDDKGRDDVQVYPTIFTSYFTVQNNNNNNLELQLFDVAGKLVLQKTLIQGTNIINTETLSKQTYYYQIKNNNSIVNTGKLIKQ